MCGTDEVHELKLTHRAQARQRRPVHSTRNCHLGNWRVHDPLNTKLMDEPFGHFERAAVNANVFAHHKDAAVALHFFPYALPDCLFKDINYSDKGEQSVLVLETDKIPPAEVIEKVSRDTGLPANKLTFILTPTRSIAGSLQVTARVLEVALHKCHTLHFDLNAIVDGYGVAPVPAPSPDFITGMGRTNDAILFGGFVQLFVNAEDAAAEQLAQQLPSSASKDYGRPFAEVFKAVNMDFYQIDPMLFSPAKVSVTNLKSGRTFFAGQFNEALLNQSFGG